MITNSNQTLLFQQSQQSVQASSQDAVQSLPNLNEIKAVPQFGMEKLHGDKLLEREQQHHSILERKVEQMQFAPSTTSTGPIEAQQAPIALQSERPIVHQELGHDARERVFIKSLNDIPVNENDELQWRMGTQKAYTQRTPFELQLYPQFTDEQRNLHHAQLHSFMEENRFKSQSMLKKGSIETKVFNIYDPMFSCARADIWSHSEVLSFGKEPGRIFKLQHQLFPGNTSNIRTGISEIQKREEEELVDPITSAIHCAAMEAKLKFKNVRASRDIVDMWKSSQFKHGQQEMSGELPAVQLRSGGVFGQQMFNKQSNIMIGNQQLQQQPLIVQKQPIMQGNFATSPGATTRNVQVTRVEERIDIQEQTLPVQQQQQPIMVQQQQPILVNSMPTTAATSTTTIGSNTVMLPQQVQPILAHVQPGTFLEEQIIGAKPVLQQAPPSRL